MGGKETASLSGSQTNPPSNEQGPPNTEKVNSNQDAGGNLYGGRTGNTRAATLVKMPRISLDIAAKYSQKYSEPVQLEQVSESMMPDISNVIAQIAAAMALSTDNENDITNLLDAITADVYVNAYSDKKPFTGYVTLPNGFRLDKTILGKVIHEHCGNNPRRFARSFAKTAIEVMISCPDKFRELLQKRADECNVTASEAIYLFDGASGAVIGRAAEIMLASMKSMRLTNADKATAASAAARGAAISYSMNDDQSTSYSNS